MPPCNFCLIIMDAEERSQKMLIIMWVVVVVFRTSQKAGREKGVSGLGSVVWSCTANRRQSKNDRTKSYGIEYQAITKLTNGLFMLGSITHVC